MRLPSPSYVALIAWILAVTLLGCAGPDSAPSEKQEAPPEISGPRPNILLIVLDTTRRDRLSTYGHPAETTPNLDRLGSEGTIFENCITPGSWTLPSHASIFTGLFPREHGTTVENIELHDSFVTLAEALGGAGYRTVGFSNNAWLSEKSGMLQGFGEWHSIFPRDWDYEDTGASITNKRVLDWLNESQDEDRPFFMFINYFEPHLPYDPPPPFDQRYLPAEADAAMISRVRKWKNPRELGYILKAPGQDVTAEQFELLRGLYDGEIAYLDSRLGELIQTFEALSLLDDTLVVVTSDHGEHFGEHGMMDHKMSLYDPLIRVPLVLRYPRGISAGTRVRGQVQTVDLYPTLLKFGGVHGAIGPGLPLVDDGSGRPFAFAEFGKPDIFVNVIRQGFPGSDFSAFNHSLKAVRGARYKYIHSSSGREELYDILSDPAEEHEIGADHPDVLSAMREQLASFEAGREPGIVRGTAASSDSRGRPRASDAAFQASGTAHAGSPAAASNH